MRPVSIEMEQKKCFFEEKNSKWLTQKKPHFPAPPILKFFNENFMDWVSRID